MNHIRLIRRATSVLATAGSSLLGLVLFAPSAFAGGDAPAIEEQYMTTLANYVHGLGLGGGSRTLMTPATAMPLTCTRWPTRY